MNIAEKLNCPERTYAGLFVLLSVVLLSSCLSRSGGYYKDDGPPERTPAHMAGIPDAVPKYERLSSTGNRPYIALGKRYVPMRSARGYKARGIASWYGKKFHGQRTSSGESYDMYQMTAAHKTLPLPTYVRVKNLRNGRSAVVKVNDRGPFLHNRLIDLSYAAAYRLGIVGTGTGSVEIAAVFPGSNPYTSLTPVNEPVVDSNMYVQFGAFADRLNAKGLQRRLRENGFDASIVPGVHSAGILYKVRTGPYGLVAEADQELARSQAFGFDTKLVVE